MLKPGQFGVELSSFNLFLYSEKQLDDINMLHI